MCRKSALIDRFGPGVPISNPTNDPAIAEVNRQKLAANGLEPVDNRSLPGTLGDASLDPDDPNVLVRE